MSAGDFFRAQFGIAGDTGQLLNVDRGETIFLDDPLRHEDRVFKVVAIPGHERDAHVLAKGQLAHINRGTIRQNVTALDRITCLYDRTLVDTGILVGPGVLCQVVNIDRRDSLHPHLWR